MQKNAWYYNWFLLSSFASVDYRYDTLNSPPPFKHPSFYLIYTLYKRNHLLIITTSHLN